jgi:hypothetical protein
MAKTDLSPKRTTTEQLIDNGGLEGDLADASAGASRVRPGDSQGGHITFSDSL